MDHITQPLTTVLRACLVFAQSCSLIENAFLFVCSFVVHIYTSAIYTTEEM